MAVTASIVKTTEGTFIPATAYVARVYGESHDEVLSRANALLAQREKQI